eukprot:superscaffoldBa00001891_g12413
MKSFASNTTGQPRLNLLATLSIENQLIQQLHDFIPKVIKKLPRGRTAAACLSLQLSPQVPLEHGMEQSTPCQPGQRHTDETDHQHIARLECYCEYQ